MKKLKYIIVLLTLAAIALCACSQTPLQRALSTIKSEFGIDLKNESITVERLAYTYDDGNTYDDLGNTNWYGWFRMENYKNVPNRDYFDTDTYDCWGYIGESDDGSHYFEVYRDGMPDDPVITMWVNVYDDHIEPILDGSDWVLDQHIDDSEAYNFNIYPYNDCISLFMYDYEGDDGTACAVSFYMRLDGTEWNEELEELPPRYEEYKAALANK
mgnify:FL=1